MKRIFLSVVLCLCLLPFFSHSWSEEKTVTFEKLASDFMKFLQLRDLESSLETVVRMRMKAEGRENVNRPIRKWKMRRAVRKIIESTSYSNGENVLHLVVRLGRFDPLRVEFYGDRSIEIDKIKMTNLLMGVYEALGPDQFLQLLNESNDRGISPAMEARNSGGPAYEALRAFISEHTFDLKPSNFYFIKSQMAAASGAVLVVNGFLTGTEVSVLAGGGAFVWASDICYKFFTRRKASQVVNKALSFPKER